MSNPLANPRTVNTVTEQRKITTMSNALKKLMKEEIREEVDNTLLTAIKNIMKNNGWDAKKVMDSMEIPPVDQIRYLALL